MWVAKKVNKENVSPSVKLLINIISCNFPEKFLSAVQSRVSRTKNPDTRNAFDRHD